MLFRQLSDATTRTLSYLVASRRGGKALLIDPVRSQLRLYLRLLEALDLELAFAVDTHTHEGHDSALGALLMYTDCVTVMGRESRVDCVARHLRDGEVLELDGLRIEAMHTPGHTPDSYSLLMDDRVFTGDTLLIRGTGRTDLGGDARQQHESLFSKLVRLPGRTLVYPAHDYNGRHVSSIEDERRLNPRLAVRSVEQYAALMQQLHPPAGHADVAERPSLHPAAPRVRELLAARAALAGTRTGAGARLV
jgi:sulfur dioxygenase